VSFWLVSWGVLLVLAIRMDTILRAERRRDRTFIHDTSGAVHMMSWDRSRKKGMSNFIEARDKYTKEKP